MPLNGVQVTVPLNLYNDISSYAQFNGIEFDTVFADCLRTGFNVMRFGTNPLVELKKQKDRLADKLSTEKEAASPPNIGSNNDITLNEPKAKKTPEPPQDNHATLNEVEGQESVSQPSQTEGDNLNGVTGLAATADADSAAKTANGTIKKEFGDRGDLKPIRRVVKRKRTLKEVKPTGEKSEPTNE